MTRPAPVSFYIPLADALQDYLLQVPSDREGTANDYSYIAPSSGTGYIRPGNTCLAECTHTLPLPSQVSPGSVSHIPLLCLRPAFHHLKAHSYNESFPAPVNAFFCSIHGLVHFLCCLSDTAGHGPGIPDGRCHTYKRCFRENPNVWIFTSIQT